MQFFMDGNGVIQASFPYSVNQGGQDAYEINLYASFAAGTVITASFKLPNGEIKSGYQLTEIGAVNDVQIASSPARLWKMTLPGEITQYYGTVTAQFFVSTATGTLPSSSTSFVVARGVPQVIDDTSPLDTITENIASLQTDLNNGYFSARALREWNALYTYGLGELVYVSADDGNVLLESLKANNTDPPYVDGQLNTASWKVALDKFVTPLSDTAPIMDGTASAGSTPEAARGDHVHPTDTTRAAAADLTNEISARQAADTALQQAVALKQNSTDNNLTTTAKTIVGAINENKVSIDGLRQDVINEDHFKGFVATAAEVSSITANANDFVYCVETGTIWTYNNGWVNSNEPYPSDATPLATTTPLMDGTATVGSSSSAARADHVHPQDTALAGRIDDLEDGTTPAGKVANSLTIEIGTTSVIYDGSTAKTVNVLSPNHVYAHQIVMTSSDDNTAIGFTLFLENSTEITTFQRLISAMPLQKRIPASGGIGNINTGTDYTLYPAKYMYKSNSNTLIAYFQKVRSTHYETFTSSTTHYTFSDNVTQIV